MEDSSRHLPLNHDLKANFFKLLSGSSCLFKRLIISFNLLLVAQATELWAYWLNASRLNASWATLSADIDAGRCCRNPQTTLRDCGNTASVDGCGYVKGKTEVMVCKKKANINYWTLILVSKLWVSNMVVFPGDTGPVFFLCTVFRPLTLLVFVLMIQPGEFNFHSSPGSAPAASHLMFSVQKMNWTAQNNSLRSQLLIPVW